MYTITRHNLSHNHTFDQCSKANERKTLAEYLSGAGSGDYANPAVSFSLMGIKMTLHTLVAGSTRSVEEYCSRLDYIHHLAHISIEAHGCFDGSCVCRN